MIGFETQASQGQPLGYVTRFAAIAWGIVLVPLGRIALVLDRYGQPMPSLIGGGFAFLYLFGGAVISLAFDMPVDRVQRASHRVGPRGRRRHSDAVRAIRSSMRSSAWARSTSSSWRSRRCGARRTAN